MVVALHGCLQAPADLEVPAVQSDGPASEGDPARDDPTPDPPPVDDPAPDGGDGVDELPVPAAFGDALVPLGVLRPTRSRGRRGPIHIMDLALVGATAYLATYSGAFAVDLHNSSSPEQVGDPTGGHLYWLATSEAGLLTAGRDDGLRLLQVGFAGGWREQAGRSSVAFTPEGVAIWQQRVFVAAQEQGLLVSDLFDLAPVASWGGAPNAIDVTVTEGIAYVGDRSRGLVIADVSGVVEGADGGITELSSVALEGGLVQHVELSPSGRHVYIAAGAVLAVVDVSDPRAPELVAQIRPGGVATGVAADGDLLALANWGDTRLYDVSDPAAPRLVAVEDSVEASMSVDLQGDLLVVGDWDHLRTYRIEADLQAPELDMDRTLTVLGDAEETPEVEVYVVIGNETASDVPLELFDVSCASAAVMPTETEATVPPGLVALVPLRVDLVAGGGRRPDRQWRTSCTLWTTDPDEAVAEVEIVVNPDGLSLGDPAPDWTLPDLGGALHTLSAQRGKVVVMTIFSSL